MYTEEIEREQRFRLALRMGVPIFFLTGILLYSLLTQYFEEIPYNFIIVIIGSLAVAVYFQFYLIYQAFNERVTDVCTHTFDNEYFESLFRKSVTKNTQTLVLFSVDNLLDINQKVGIKKANRMLYALAGQIDAFLTAQNIFKPIISRIRSGDFVIMIEGQKQQHRMLFDRMYAKMSASVINGIETHASIVMIDTEVSQEYEKLIDRLYELQEEQQRHQMLIDEDEENLSDLEIKVAEALEQRRFSIMQQRSKSESNYVDVSVKLFEAGGKIIHEKRFLPIINRGGMRRRYDYEKIITLLEMMDEHSRYVVKVDADTLRNRLFLDDMITLSKTYDLNRLAFVFHEKEYYANIKRFKSIIKTYRDMGIVMIIDDIGSNHVSQLYMKELPLDVIRFEGSFGRKISDKRYLALLEGLNLAAHRMGLLTWVRMIEEEAGYLQAQDLGIDIISGNYVAKMEPITPTQENTPR